jgi:hypothetical protein
MVPQTKLPLLDAPLSRATRALFAFLFRNALPVDASIVNAAPLDDISRRRRRERVASGAGLVSATTYSPSSDLMIPAGRPAARRRRDDGRVASGGG